FFFAKAKPASEEDRLKGKRGHEFVKGMGISLLNLLVIPYWIFYGTLLTEHGLLERENIYVLIFAAGATAGAFALLVCYAFLGAKILSKSESVTRWVNKFIGLVLIGFGVYQVGKLVNW
ncbi:MAG: LysE family transporter, partial [Proteobacteria bacterium]|nr:LysE family transporter [Pseudomonadota bacterium]